MDVGIILSLAGVGGIGRIDLDALADEEFEVMVKVGVRFEIDKGAGFVLLHAEI